MKKRLLSFTAAVLSAAFLFSACASVKKPLEILSEGPSVVVTVFPVYDWVLNILGENPAGIDVTMLMDSGTDLHSFQPSTSDILRVSACDLFIHVGGNSDRWVSDALRGSTNPEMHAVSLIQTLGSAAKEEELLEGMEEEEEEEGDGPEYDEHVWLSLRNASLLIEALLPEIQRIDPDHADLYQKNAEAYQKKLEALDASYQAAVDQAPYKSLVFGDRFPFRYLADDYGLTCYAAFSGCSAESEASFETVIFLAKKTEELKLPAVLTIEGSDRKIAQTVIQNTASKDQKILTLDSMQAVTARDVREGAAYLEIMEKNLAVLREALGL